MNKIEFQRVTLSPKEDYYSDVTFILLLIFGEDEENEPIYVYLGVKAESWLLLQEKILSGEKIELYKWGKVFAHGKGTEPSDEHRRYMEDTYFFNHDKINVGVLN